MFLCVCGEVLGLWCSNMGGTQVPDNKNAFWS